MSILRIYFSSQWRDSGSACPWALCDDAGAVLQSGAGTLASMPKATSCVGILDADRVLLLSARTPPGARRQWRTALPFLVEGRTLADPEENHVVLCGTPTGGEVRLAVTDKAWLRRIAEACRTASLPLRQAWSEVQLLPRVASGWTLAWNGRGGFLHTGACAGIALDAVDAGMPPLAMQLMLERAAAAPPERIEVRLMPMGSGELAAMPQWPDFPVPLVEGEPWDWRRAPLPAVGNLLAGALAPPSRPMEWWPRLRPALALAALLLAVQATGTNLQWAMLAHEAHSLHQQMNASFRKAFGDEVALVNAPLQMQRDIAQLRHQTGRQDSGDFLPLLDLSAEPLAALPRQSVRELHFESGRLQVQVNVANRQALARLQAALRDAGLQVRAETRSSGNGYSAKLSIRPQGAI